MLIRSRPPKKRPTRALVDHCGEVAEWLNAPHSKCGIRATVSGVFENPPPLFRQKNALNYLFLLIYFGHEILQANISYHIFVWIVLDMYGQITGPGTRRRYMELAGFRADTFRWMSSTDSGPERDCPHLAIAKPDSPPGW